MTDPGLLQALDYILNKSDSATIEVLAEAVIRRRRNISLFNAIGDMPDPQRMASELSEKINTSLGSGIEGMRKQVREMMVRIVREHAPELADYQIDELCEAWLPEDGGAKESLPSDVLLSMIEQFIAFSNGTMRKSVDEGLRKEIGEWPSRYWKAFPPVVRQIITDYLKERISEKDFKSRIVIALGIK
jgi:hypothetical protein